MGMLLCADLGLADYSESLSLQKELVGRRLSGEISDTLLLLEHTPTITMGTSGGEDGLLVSPEIIERAGIKIIKTDRGGDVTYHGPGQLVGYPIFDLREHGKDVHVFLRNLELMVIESLSDFGVIGETIPGLTGVWVGGEKICSIGLAVRRWISYHGFALNVETDFDHWSFIHPCGLVDRKVTSLGRLLGESPGMDRVKESVVAKCGQVFGLKPVLADENCFGKFGF